MISRVVIVTLMAIGSASAAHAADSRPRTNREIAIQAMMDMAGYKDMTVFDRYFGEPYIQHRTDLGDGLVELKKFQTALLTPRPYFNTNHYRSISDGDMVFLHSVYEGSPRFNGKPLAAMDLFRFKNGRIMEHWDVLNLQGEHNASGHSAVDGPAMIADLDRTEANRALVTQFVQVMFVDRKVDRADEFIDDKRYFEHDQQGSDGLEAFKAGAKASPRPGYKVHRILAEGNFAVVEAEGSGGTLILYDLYRMQGGKIVEHWDVENTVPARETWKNDHGPFECLARWYYDRR